MDLADSDVFLLESDDKKRSQFSPYLLFQISFPIIGGFLFGYDTGVISGAILLIRKYFRLSTFLQEIVVSATILSCAISSLLGGYLSERIGRRRTLLISSVSLILGSILMGFAPLVFVLVLGRVVVGIGVGLAATTCPVYIAEISPEQIRGRLVLLYNLSITAGQLVASIIDALFFKIGKEGWRYMLGVALVPALIQLIGLMFIPESHRWLISKDRVDEARNVIKRENRMDESEIDEYIDTILQSHKDTELEIKKHKMSERSIICQIMNDRVARTTLAIGCGLQIFQQIVGINTVMYYSATVIRMAGVRDIYTILWLAALVALFNFIPSFFGFFLIDRVGRRKLILFSLVGVLMGLILLASTFQVLATQSDIVQFKDQSLVSPADRFCSSKTNCDACTNSQKCGFCYLASATNSEVAINSTCLATQQLYSDHSDRGWCSKQNSSNITTNKHWLYDYCISKYSWLVILGMILYLLFFSIGMGPVPWAVTSEIYPLWCRSTNMAISTSTNWTFNLIISVSFLTLTESITKYGTFWLFSGFAFIGIIFIYKCLPETNQRTLEEITTLIGRN